MNLETFIFEHSKNSLSFLSNILHKTSPHPQPFTSLHELETFGFQKLKRFVIDKYKKIENYLSDDEKKIIKEEKKTQKIQKRNSSSEKEGKDRRCRHKKLKRTKNHEEKNKNELKTKKIFEELK